jgi:hypothetical protein
MNAKTDPSETLSVHLRTAFKSPASVKILCSDQQACDATVVCQLPQNAEHESRSAVLVSSLGRLGPRSTHLRPQLSNAAVEHHTSSTITMKYTRCRRAHISQ